jgi:hypothetical protein
MLNPPIPKDKKINNKTANTIDVCMTLGNDPKKLLIFL